jgi:hypothetical protein
MGSWASGAAVRARTVWVRVQPVQNSSRASDLLLCGPNHLACDMRILGVRLGMLGSARTTCGKKPVLPSANSS